MAKIGTIEGLNDCLKCLDAAPENVVKMTKNAMREGGKAASRVIRAKTPARWRRLVGYKVTKGQLSGNTYALVGYFNKGKSKGTAGAIDDWFKAYWKNYGTLARRDASHHFSNPVKRNVRGRRNNVGQPATLFFEQSLGGCYERFLSAFRDSMSKQEQTLYDR